MKHYLGLDIGTTTVSISIAEAPTLQQVGAFNVLNESTIRPTVQDPDKIIRICLELLEKAECRFGEIAGIGITGQMHGIVLIDKDSKAVSPLYTWQCELGKTVSSEIEDKTGFKVPSGYGFSTLYALKKTDKIPENAVSFCSILDYLALQLTGEKKPVIHASLAASFGLYDLEKNSFDTEAIEALGFDKSFIPKTVFEEIIVGQYKNIPVFIPIGDNQASNLGVTNGEEKVLCINCGTGSQVSVAVKDWHGHKCQEVRPFVKGTYLLTGSALCGGRAYAILRNFCSEIATACGLADVDMYRILDGFAASDSCPLTVDTRFCGTRENPEITGSVIGITEENFTPSALTKGFLKGMAVELFDMFEQMGVHDIKRIVGSGNGIKKNKAFAQVLMNQFQMNVENSEISEEAAYGALLVAAHSSQKKSSLSVTG